LISRFPLSRISFRFQILLLGVTAVVLLCSAILAGFIAWQYTRSAVLRSEQRRLAQATNSLVREFGQEIGAKSGSTRTSGLTEFSDESELRGISASVLQNVDGVEGGFYDFATGQVVGYAFPTSPTVANRDAVSSYSVGSGGAVVEVAKESLSESSRASRVLTGDRDVMLIDALPIRDGDRYVGSAWTATRMTSVPGTNRFRTYLIAAALGLAAFACVVLTLLVVRGLQSGVKKIEDGLEGLEEDLSGEIPLNGDPSEIRQIAGAINRLGAALREKIESEKRIEDRLRHAERLAALGRLVAGVAHEVRNPLATIRLRVQMCQLDAVNPEVKRSCAIALQEIERLNGMVNRLLTFSRPVELQPGPVYLGRLVEQRLGNFTELAQQQKVKLVAKFNRGSKAVEVDQNRIAQVFDNIIQNAIDAMSASGGTLCVSVSMESRDGESVDACVEFSDTGDGIRTDLMDRIFDPFFTTKPSGTGLGLSICHEIVQAHAGEITVTSAEGCGTTVRVMLRVPVVEPAERTA
jgi:signal transduction histidine kinase